MRIEAVVTCVNYADFLAHTLPFNRGIFDHLIIVTTPTDEATARLCRFWNIQCVTTRAFTEPGPFCKAAGINVGLSCLRRDDWLVHLDADIALPPRTRSILERADLDPACIYGIDRTLCHSHEEWSAFLSAPTPQHEQNVFVHAGPFPLGTRIAKYEHDGYVPIGFFQMFHASTGRTHYHEGHTDAARSDMLFAMQWRRRHRMLIPELFAYHLESAPGPMGANWGGRHTPYFGPRSLGSATTAPCPAEPVPVPLGYPGTEDSTPR